MRISGQILFASGTKGKQVRADGKGSTLARGYYYVDLRDQSGTGMFGPFTTKTAARQAYRDRRAP